jgi:hypothetical protein
VLLIRFALIGILLSRLPLTALSRLLILLAGVVEAALLSTLLLSALFAALVLAVRTLILILGHG